MKNIRTNWIDYARGIGIILVVYGHALRGIHSAHLDMREGFFLFSDAYVYSFHMQLFFFLSGIFFTSSYIKRGFEWFIVDKLKVIVYPYFIWSVIQTTIEVVMANYTNSGISVSALFSVFYKPRAPFWFLYELFKMFVICAVIYKLAYKSKLQICLIAALLTLVINEITGMKIISSHFIFFVIGIVFGERGISKISLLNKFPALSTLIMLVFVITGYLAITGSYNKEILMSLVLASLGILVVLSISVMLAEINLFRVIKYLGEYSMCIYLTHIIFASGTRIMLRTAGVESVSIHLVTGVLMGLICPLALYFFCKKYRLMYLFEFPSTKPRKIAVQQTT